MNPAQYRADTWQHAAQGFDGASLVVAALLVLAVIGIAYKMLGPRNYSSNSKSSNN